MRGWFIWLLLSLAASAQEVRSLELRCQPPAAIFYQDRPLDSHDGRFLFHKTNFFDAAQNKQVDRTFVIQDLAQEYAGQEVSLSWNDLLRGTYPPADQPALKLQLKSPAAYAWRHYPGWILAGLIALAGALLWAGRSWRRQQAKLQFASQLAQQKASSDDQNLGRQIGPYQITRRLGSGGQASVYLASPLGESSNENAVAIKFFAYDQDEEGRRRQQREIKTLARLDHPNVIRLLHLIEESEGHVAVVLDWVRGQSLDQLLLQPTDWQRRLKWMDQLFRAVSYCHKCGVMHRDLKPPNLMINGNDDLVVIDFGMAKSDFASQLTAKDTVLGTPDYLSPEQWQGDPSPASDQWALGVIGYELLASRRPFTGQSIAILATAIMTQAHPAMPAQVPAALAAVVDRMLQKDPAGRFPGVAEAYQAWTLACREA